MVEHTTENRGVGGSIPPLATEIGGGPIGLLANGFGAVIVAGFLTFLFPDTVSPDDSDRLMRISVPVFIVYMALSLPLGGLWAMRRAKPIADWQRSGRPASEHERAAVLRYPLRFAGVVATF